MSTEIQPFEFEGNKVRTLADGDEVMFVASDIAKILGYRDAANLARNLDNDERGIHEVSTPSGTQNMTVLTESGLYRAILNRETAYVKNEEAQAFVKRFQRWVTHEVLPQIRRTGGYIPTTDVDDDMTILAKAVMIGQRTMEEQKRRIAEQQSRIVELEPQRADPEGDGLGLVPHQGDGGDAFGRARDHQPHTKGHRQGAALFHRPLLPEEAE